jgi:hypothetical protein
MNRLILTLLVVLVGVIATLFWAPIDSSWISAVTALAALLVALISAFKDEIFPFHLSVLTDEVILAPSTAPSHDSLALMFPLVFMNNGNGSGVMEALSIKIKGNNSTKLYTPIVEIDFGIYITAKRKLHAESIIGSFGSFPLHGKESIKKHILFSQEENSEKYPFNTWNEGNYTVTIYVKHSHQAKPVECATFKRFISKKMLDEYKTGTGASLGGSRELDV